MPPARTGEKLNETDQIKAAVRQSKKVEDEEQMTRVEGKAYLRLQSDRREVE
ncbi:MAG TPA: hypothetical protein VK742_05070 [Candidatus Sulfotelmatobacter sp.]|nr:hypothetical protein [Candidatus Sulfotelmatobacter sp.]